MTSDNRKHSFSTSPFIYLIIRNAVFKMNIQSAVLIMIRDTNNYIECALFTDSRIEPKTCDKLHYFDQELERMGVEARERDVTRTDRPFILP